VWHRILIASLFLASAFVVPLVLLPPTLVSAATSVDILVKATPAGGVIPPADANPGEGWVGLRPEIDMTNISALGVPTLVHIGNYYGYSLPIYNNDNEEVYSDLAIPGRWDGESDFIVYLYVCVSNANEKDNRLNMQLEWEHYTSGADAVPATANILTYEQIVASNAQYQTHTLQYTIDYDIDGPDIITAHDILGLRVRRIAATQDEIIGEVILVHSEVYFHRGDILGEEDEMAVGIILIALVILALGLTVVMFATREMMLGFPCVIFWAVLGGYAYTESTTAWGDWQYFLFFASMGMAIFCALAMYGLREKRDTIADEEMERGDGGYIDEEYWGEEKDEFEPEKKERRRTRELRERAERRRAGEKAKRY